MSAIEHIRAWFGGRISRKTWWIWFIALFLAGTGIVLAFGLQSFDPNDLQQFRPSPWQTLAAVLLFLPALTITLKRLNDRNHPKWIGYVWGGLGVLQLFSPYLGVLENPLSPTKTDWAVMFPALLFNLWVFIDNGFLKGTAGANRYGPDPLAPTASQSGPVRVPHVTKQSGRTWGALARNFIVGLCAAMALLYIMLPYSGLQRTATLVVEALIHGQLGNLEEDMQANPAGWKAFQAGKEAARKKDYGNAVTHYDAALASYGAETGAAGRVHMWRGHALTRLRRWDDALKDYSAAIEIDPDASALRYSSRAYVYRQLHHDEKALSDYDEAIARWPGYPDYYLRRGSVLENLKRPKEALASYDKAIEVAHDDYKDIKQTHDLYTQANRFLKSMDLSKFEPLVQRAAEDRDKDIGKASFRRGMVLTKMGRHDDALAAFNESVRLRPDNYFGYVNRGWLHEKQGDIAAAKADYEKAAELKKPNDWLNRALKRIRSKSE